MATTTEKQQQAEAEFAEGFGADVPAKAEQTEDEAFGLTDPAPAEPAAEQAAAAAAEPAPAGAPAEPVLSDAEKALQEREAALAAREAELNAREAAMATSSAERVETVDGKPVTTAIEEEPTADTPTVSSADRDYSKELAEDFGEDFVALLKGFIEQICAAKVGEGLGDVTSTVDEVIEHLRSERQASHFKAIAAAHEDFMDVVEGPEFSAWKEAQTPEEQTRIQHVVDAGSAQEIIDMLTTFKNSKGGSVDEDALAEAEGVRGGGISLPKAPPADDDYAAAWNNS